MLRAIQQRVSFDFPPPHPPLRTRIMAIVSPPKRHAATVRSDSRSSGNVVPAIAVIQAQGPKRRDPSAGTLACDLRPQTSAYDLSLRPKSAEFGEHLDQSPTMRTKTEPPDRAGGSFARSATHPV